MRFNSFDGMQIPNIFYKPYQATPQSKAPALVWVHGGPGGQTRRQYSAAIQYLVNHGYVDPRHQQPRQLRLRQVVQHRGRPQARPRAALGLRRGQEVPAEPRRTSTRTGSGSSAAATAATWSSRRSRSSPRSSRSASTSSACRTGCGRSSRSRSTGSPSAWRSTRRSATREKDRDFLKEISPLFHADQIRKPLIVLQGANDPRVIKPESDEIVAAVKKNGVPVEYVVFPDEGHGFSKKKNQIEAWSAIRAFLDKYLKARRRRRRAARRAPAAARAPFVGAYAAHARARRSTPSRHRVGVEHVTGSGGGRRSRRRATRAFPERRRRRAAARPARTRSRRRCGQLHPEREPAGGRRPTSRSAGGGASSFVRRSSRSRISRRRDCRTRSASPSSRTAPSWPTSEPPRSAMIFSRVMRASSSSGAADPADAQAAPEELRERADGQHRGGGVERRDRRGRLAAERQVGQRVVLEDRDAHLLREPRERAAAGLRHHRAGRILKRRHQVDQPRRERATSSRRRSSQAASPPTGTADEPRARGR